MSGNRKRKKLVNGRADGNGTGSPSAVGEEEKGRGPASMPRKENEKGGAVAQKRCGGGKEKDGGRGLILKKATGDARGVKSRCFFTAHGGRKRGLGGWHWATNRQKNSSGAERGSGRRCGFKGKKVSPSEGRETELCLNQRVTAS